MPDLKTFYQGEIIFAEGQEGDTIYVVRSGSIEISLTRESKKIVLATLGEGSCFGEMASMASATRSATARALSYTEAYALSASNLEALLQKSHPLVRLIMKDLSKRVSHLNESVAREVAATSPIVAFAQVLALRAQAAEPSQRGSVSRELPYNECIALLGNIVDMLPYRIKAILQYMAGLNLVSLQGSGKQITVLVDPQGLVERAKNIIKNLGDHVQNRLQAEFELIEIDSLAEFIGVDQEKLYKKLAQGELPESLFLCRKSATLALLEEKGKEFFERRKIKSIEEFDNLNDLELVDHDTLQEVFGGIDAVNVAKLLKTVDVSAKQLILRSLSERMRGIIENTAAAIGQVEERDTLLLEQHVVETVKSKLLNKVGV